MAYTPHDPSSSLLICLESLQSASHNGTARQHCHTVRDTWMSLAGYFVETHIQNGSVTDGIAAVFESLPQHQMLDKYDNEIHDPFNMLLATANEYLTVCFCALQTEIERSATSITTGLLVNATQAHTAQWLHAHLLLVLGRQVVLGCHRNLPQQGWCRSHQLSWGTVTVTVMVTVMVTVTPQQVLVRSPEGRGRGWKCHRRHQVWSPPEQQKGMAGDLGWRPRW